ncbi:hypothetical protein C8R43DRAFT_1128740 [Mycena crocata]|nr:hypothetical protein C8R43DRAFT_1128740 [Mycena crocata]
MSMHLLAPCYDFISTVCKPVCAYYDQGHALTVGPHVCPPHADPRHDDGDLRDGMGSLRGVLVSTAACGTQLRSNQKQQLRHPMAHTRDYATSRAGALATPCVHGSRHVVTTLTSYKHAQPILKTTDVDP